MRRIHVGLVLLLLVFACESRDRPGIDRHHALAGDGIIHHHLDSAPVEDWLDTVLYLDMKLYLQEDLLVKVDRASMANSLEVRVPFLDHEFVNFATRLPSHLKLRRLQTKYILKRSARDLLPPQIINRSKKGFGIPVAKWINADLKSLFSETFAENKIKDQGIFHSGARVGAAASLILMPWLISQIGWRMTFVANAFLGLGVGRRVVVLVPRQARRTPQSQ